MDVNGEVHILTSPKATQYQAFPLNKIVYIKAPSSGVLSAVVAAPGYKEMGKAINYEDPAASSAEIGTQQEAIISFPLVRVKLGDYVEFANVHFFPNTAILQPEAKNELDGFVDLMKENLKYKIKIHGHCNGKKSRDITSKGNSTNFFAPDPANLKETASAKKLSEYRAQIVKDYMVSQGIEASRIGVKGEGGNQMVYLSNSSHAARNDRVEIEVSKSR
jgi:outer membrane protein OmpA-like peptidoglycan-associated protein